MEIKDSRLGQNLSNNIIFGDKDEKYEICGVKSHV